MPLFNQVNKLSGGDLELKDSNKLMKPLAKALKALTPQTKKANKDLDKFLRQVERIFKHGDFEDQRYMLIDAVAGIRENPDDDSITVTDIAKVTEALVGIKHHVLNDRNRDKLAKELDKAIDSLTPNAGKACGELDKFLIQVNKLVDKGALDEDQASTLIEGANALKNGWGC